MNNLVPRLNILNFLKFNKKKLNFDFFVADRGEKSIFGTLSQSAWSLLLIALWRKKIFPNKKINILIPEYFCNTTLTPLRKMGFNLIFYKINLNQEPDKNYLKILSNNNDLDLLLIVDYFGLKNDYSFVRDFCKNQNCWLIKDSAHNLSEKDDSNDADFIFFSPHKLLSIPMGSILVINSDGPSELSFKKYNYMAKTNSWYLQITKELANKKFNTKKNLFFSFKWFIKRLYQSFNIKINLNKKILFNENISDDKISSFLNPKIDFFSKFIINFNKLNFYDEIDSRLRLSLVLEKILNNLDQKIYGKISYINKPKLNNSLLPYYAVIECDKAEKLFKDFQEMNIDCISWPDQAKEIFNSDFEICKNLRNKRVFVPLFNLRMYRDLIKFHKNIINKKSSFSIQWNNFEKNFWDKNLKLINDNNLLQTWNYGEFKKKYEKFEIIRGIIQDSQKKTIGLVQLIAKNFLGLRILRLNRGPILIEKNQSLSNSIVDRVKKDLFSKKTILFSVAPELEFTSCNIIAPDFKPYQNPSWTSSRLDLTISLENIFANLKKEWRKDLKKSLKLENLEISISKEKKDIDLIVNHHKELLKNKKFKSINLNLINHLNENSDLLTLICKYKNSYIGSLSIAKHYPGATCLINPIFDHGRKLKINHFLLWNAIKYLKKDHFLFLDTGGIDIKNTPGPANFKLGINGKIYNLIGEKNIY